MAFSRPVIDVNLCTGCGSCVRTCPKGAITMQSTENDTFIISDESMDLKWKIESMEEDLRIVKAILGKAKGR